MPAFRRPLGLSLLAAALLGFARPTAAQGMYARVIGHEGPISLDSLAVAHELTGSRRDVYRALIAVLDSLKVPAAQRDSVRAFVVQPEVVVTRRLGGESMTSALDCGSGITGPYAGYYRVRIAYAAWVDSVDAGRSRIRLGLAAGAEDTGGSVKNPVRCGSRGAFEQRIFQLTERRLQR